MLEATHRDEPLKTYDTEDGRGVILDVLDERMVRRNRAMLLRMRSDELTYEYGTSQTFWRNPVIRLGWNIVPLSLRRPHPFSTLLVTGLPLDRMYAMLVYKPTSFVLLVLLVSKVSNETVSTTSEPNCPFRDEL